MRERKGDYALCRLGGKSGWSLEGQMLARLDAIRMQALLWSARGPGGNLCRAYDRTYHSPLDPAIWTGLVFRNGRRLPYI